MIRRCDLARYSTPRVRAGGRGCSSSAKAPAVLTCRGRVTGSGSLGGEGGAGPAGRELGGVVSKKEGEQQVQPPVQHRKKK